MTKDPPGETKRRSWNRRGYLLLALCLLFCGICATEDAPLAALSGLVLMFCGWMVGLADGDSQRDQSGRRPDDG